MLVLGVGRATRLLRYLSGAEKEYRGEVVLGSATSTLDDEGEVLERFDMAEVSVDDARAAAAALTGEIDQMVPMVSAVKVGGRRLHRLAREGAEVERPVRRVRVDRFEVGQGSEPGTLAIDVRCSAGTYVRVLAEDLGRALGGGAHLRRLRRTRAGSFSEADAVSLDALAAAFAEGDHGALRPPLGALEMERASVAGEVLGDVRHGRPLERGALGVSGDGPFAVVGPGGELLAVYEAAAEGRVRPAVVLDPS